MEYSTLVKPLSEFTILIVDDEEVLLSFLHEALGTEYNVTTASNGTEAIALLTRGGFDILVSDLKLPDMSGIDILKFAKEQDELIEAIIMTGYATLDSATSSINLGASGYLVKPLALDELTYQINRAIAQRSFHLKSQRVLERSEQFSPDEKTHLYDITRLYNFSRRLILSFELPEMIQIILSDISERMHPALGVVSINFLEFSEMYAFPDSSSVDEKTIRAAMELQWNQSFEAMDIEKFRTKQLPLVIFKGKKSSSPLPETLDIINIPMIVKGRSIGALTMYHEAPFSLAMSEYQFLYVYTSLIASIVERAYIDMQSQLLAKTDALTGVANYRLLHETLGREISRADRKKNEFAIILIDIDNFKKVNDTYGHPAGNEVLKNLTTRISGIIRQGDLLARYGGEEFAIILPDTTRAGAIILAERIRQSTEKASVPTANAVISYTISLGVAMYQGLNPCQKESLITNADQALYESKRMGKNRVTMALP